ncbi:enoyl-CoA hydratase/isomerase family protein [Acrocarpospora catenulata]|uniref:enoyl-CoA hydratase/isomerase family protein n=1 Tax=Acrocarpospora catenulata TaxID=2836182 RepID=UPI001BD9E308|nr:enoyl-CoA hydratase/isomerase family protein [Acrocarpospora catenulata]
MPGVLDRELRDGVLLLTMRRPAQMNALSSELLAALGSALTDAVADPAVRILHLTGSGRAFCAGADLTEAAELTTDPASFRRWLLLWKQVFQAIGETRKPVVALLNGLTLAGGLELALACDFILASSSARVGDVHANYGLVPGGGGTQRLPDAVGTRYARWLMYTGAILTAEEAHRVGLVQQVFSDETFVEDTWAMGAAMARRSATGLGFMKRMTAPARVNGPGLDLELEGAVHVVTGVDGREGLAAFREKRVPRFTARPDLR